MNQTKYEPEAYDLTVTVIVKFMRARLTITGELVDGTPFKGTDIILVIRK